MCLNHARIALMNICIGRCGLIANYSVFYKTAWVFLPEDDGYDRHHHHAVEQESEKDDDDEDVERFAMSMTEARHCGDFSVVNAPTVKEPLHSIAAVVMKHILVVHTNTTLFRLYEVQ